MCLVEVQKKSLIKSIPPFFFFFRTKAVPVCSNDEVWQRCHGERKITSYREKTCYNLSAKWLDGWMLL